MDDPDLMTEKWLDQFTEILDQIAPFRQRKVKNSYAPFIDKELKGCSFLVEPSLGLVLKSSFCNFNCLNDPLRYWSV